MQIDNLIGLVRQIQDKTLDLVDLEERLDDLSVNIHTLKFELNKLLIKLEEEIK